jgi:hypothetical protein
VKLMAILREMKYRGRHAWVATKLALGLPVRSDQTFFVDHFSRLLKAGAIGRRCKVMANGKNDGAGSQAQAAMSAICFAHAHGLEYIHRPFTSIAHAEMEMTCWVRQCEDYFHLGHGSRHMGDIRCPILPLDQIVRDQRLWSEDVVAAAPHYLHYCNQDAQAWEQVLPTIRRNYRANKGSPIHDVFTIAVHIRRGDVSLENKKVARAFTPNTSFINTLETITQLLSDRVSEYRIRVFSQGDRGMFAEFQRLGCEFCLDQPALWSHRELADANVLVMSQGSFSYTAAQLNEGIVLYDPQKYRQMRDWIVRTSDGLFDKGLFSRRLDRLLEAGALRQ